MAVCQAANELTELTGQEVFVPISLDLDSLAAIDEAAEDLAGRGRQLDTAILNAGIAPPPDLTMTDAGIELTVSSSLSGHHRFTMRLLEHELLAPHASIVIAGSEAARSQTIEAQMKMTDPAVCKPSDVYATAKVFVAWWAAELARKLSEGVTVNAVSPGSTPETNAIRNAPSTCATSWCRSSSWCPGCPTR